MESTDKSKKIIFISTPIFNYDIVQPENYFTTAPLGLGYLATIARSKGFSIELIDCEAEKIGILGLSEKIKLKNPEIICISLISANYGLAKKMISLIHPNITVICGGPHATLVPKKILQENPNIDIVFRGEAEESFTRFLDSYPDIDLAKIKGICYRKNNNIKIGEILRVNELDKLPFIDRSLFGNDPYDDGNLIEASISGSRGCNNNCVFCSVPKISGNQIRYRSVENIIKEIKHLNKRYNVNSIHFVDDNFTFNKFKLARFCEQLKNLPFSLKWRCLARISDVDERILCGMADAGCYKIGFGIESGSAKIQQFVTKKIDKAHAKNVISLCKRLGIKTKTFFTIGYPQETEEDIEMSIEFAKFLNPDEANFNILRAFPGTPLYSYLKKQNFSEKELCEYKQHEDILGSLKEKNIPYFDILQRFLKYQVSHKISINNSLSLKRLIALLKKAYIDFYINKQNYMKIES